MLTSSFAAVVPIVCVTLGGLAAMVAEAFRKDDERMPIGILGVIGLAFSMAACLVLWNRNASAFNGTIQADNFGLFVCVTIVVVGLLTMALSGPAIETERLPAGEYYTLTLFAIAGMMMMALATDLLIIFVALEILSLSVYVLTGLRRDDDGGALAHLDGGGEQRAQEGHRVGTGHRLLGDPEAVEQRSCARLVAGLARLDSVYFNFFHELS